MQRLKTCSGCAQERLIWKSQGKNKYCQPCWFRISPPKQLSSKPTPIKRSTAKRSRQQRVYQALRLEQLKDVPSCELGLPGCTGMATEVHHAKGRIGDLLIDRRYYKSTCHTCHRWVTEHSREAIELGHSVSRLSNDQTNTHEETQDQPTDY